MRLTELPLTPERVRTAIAARENARGIAWLKTMDCPHLLHTRENYMALGLERQA